MNQDVILSEAKDLVLRLSISSGDLPGAGLFLESDEEARPQIPRSTLGMTLLTTDY